MICAKEAKDTTVAMIKKNQDNILIPAAKKSIELCETVINKEIEDTISRGRYQTTITFILNDGIPYVLYGVKTYHITNSQHGSSYTVNYSESYDIETIIAYLYAHCYSVEVKYEKVHIYRTSNYIEGCHLTISWDNPPCEDEAN